MMMASKSVGYEFRLSEHVQKAEALRLVPNATSVPCQVSGYSLLIQAVDSGIPAMSSTTTVNIDVSDVNDNSPVFTPANYTAVIQVSNSCQLVTTCLAQLLHSGLLSWGFYGK